MESALKKKTLGMENGMKRERERGGETYDHFIDENTECPPIDGGGVSSVADNLGRDILYSKFGLSFFVK